MYVGNAGPFLSACIAYESVSSNTLPIVPLMIGFGVLLILLLVVVAVVCVCKRRIRRKQVDDDDHYDNNEVEMSPVVLQQRPTHDLAPRSVFDGSLLGRIQWRSQDTEVGCTGGLGNGSTPAGSRGRAPGGWFRGA